LRCLSTGAFGPNAQFRLPWARLNWTRVDGALQAAPAPRFAPGAAGFGHIPRRDEHRVEILASIGRSAAAPGA
jgi:hypothetical protein